MQIFKCGVLSRCDLFITECWFVANEVFCLGWTRITCLEDISPTHIATIPTIPSFLNLEHKEQNQFSQKLHLISPTFFFYWREPDFTWSTCIWFIVHCSPSCLRSLAIFVTLFTFWTWRVRAIFVLHGYGWVIGVATDMAFYTLNRPCDSFSKAVHAKLYLALIFAVGYVLSSSEKVRFPDNFTEPMKDASCRETGMNFLYQ